MKVISTPYTNVVFRLPGGTDDNNLPVFVGDNEQGEKVIVSTWELDDEERAAIAQGATISLVVWGEGTPPVALSVDEP
jgi:hypothetical protein